MMGRGPVLTALAIIPDREMARQFTSAVDQNGVFQIVSEFKCYPSQQSIELRIRQTKPDVVLLDLSSDLGVACELIRAVTTLDQPTHIIGLHQRHDSEAILRSLRMGASEFLYAPFDLKTQTEAITRIHRLIRAETADEIPSGSIIAFSPAKPGSGASTLAAQTAFALRRSTSNRVLLADFDLMGGTLAFYLKLTSTKSLLDALQFGEALHDSVWPTFVTAAAGVDILAAPETPYAGGVDPTRLHAVLEYASMNYDWVIIDLPVIFQGLSLTTVSESDRTFLVSTSELASLHLARKAVNLLNQLGFSKERFQVILNCINRHDEIAGSNIEKLLNCAVYSCIPNDYFSLHTAVTLGQPVDGHSKLGKAIESLAIRLSGNAACDRKKPGAAELKATPLAVY